MKLNYITLTHNAAKEIVQSRKLQSLDFEESSLVINIANGEMPDESLVSLPIRFRSEGKGVIIIHNNDKYETERNSITFDFKSISFDDISDPLKVSCIQKALRFCIKFWENLGHNSSEIIPLDSTKGVVFPFPTNSGNPYKIVMELAPFKNKSNKNNKYKGKHILAYKFSKQAGAKSKEECEVSSISKALDIIFQVETYAVNKKTVEKDRDSSSGAVDLDKDDLLNTTNLLGRKNPIGLLSDKQKAFVESNWNHPARISGPAGTGKTICLILKALKAVSEQTDNIRALFIVPSTAVKNTVEYLLKVTAESAEFCNVEKLQNIKVRTIQQVCMEFLGQDISTTELLDEDSYEAKQTQLLYIMDLLEEVKDNVDAYKKYLSKELYELLKSEDSLSLSELFIHEFGVAIKGRCGSNKEIYSKHSELNFSLPTKSEDDRYFVFSLFEKYQCKLDELAQFDPDDIALSAIGRLESPLWRRRRSKEGYDLIIADELHLLNFNELCIIHFLTKTTATAPISFAMDATQAIGDIAWQNSSVLEYLQIGEFSNEEEVIDLKAVFRCSATVTRLASMITSSGTSLFTNFIDPLVGACEVQLDINELQPEYILENEFNQNIHMHALDVAEVYKDKLGCLRHKIAIIYFDRLMFEEAKENHIKYNKPVSCLIERGDIELLELAKEKNDYVIAMADYVGGLEFEAVVLVGVDKGRMPREDNVYNTASQLFQNYTAHNRLYVAITRAAKAVAIVGDRRRGASPILESAIKNRALDVVD
ncbi:UvrD/REP helicase [Pseudoalteromonas sp. THAF3]|uniref:UvrD-helicase domain-containing protein n=1 Tax=Pseudoalteromonas TaxID=53246 RepID=UPI00110B7D71|nr:MULTISPECIES: UvrD-helicase domain-containing protein [Pseudoalteromonas]QFU04209.1 UvrD/REP helicase [Pseudoalteromonas sp. THAF3]TMO43258.1 hypothetical protein CWC24_16535 [Pseudoalteromonas ruthenica]TMO52513.1 hypothetical protein CWC23_02270 [Pseudoalteromonas ruthenica]